MNIPNIKDLIGNGKRVKFVRFQNNVLWYKTESNFEFPIYTDDIKKRTFLPEGKASSFVRWIRKYIQFLEASSR